MAEKTPRNLVRGLEMQNIPVVEDAYLLMDQGVIRDFGPMAECPDRADETIDAEGGSVLPCWCDSHTHIVYAGSREQEFVWKIKGMSYEEIARQGGGILNSAKRLQHAPEEELLEAAWGRLNEMVKMGTGAIEIKSGYGLTPDAEIKMLRVARQLGKMSGVPVRTTFLGAHALPVEFREDRAGYVRQLTEVMMPKIAEEGLADYCDVFCDRGFFTPEETDHILKAGLAFGLKPKIHANELDYSGGVQVGVANGAVSVDHLECVGEEEIETLLHSNTIPTLLPSTAFFLNIEFPPARRMLQANLPVALASDYNPGSSPSGRMPFVLSLACIKMKMTPQEAVQAATLNGAAAMEWGNELGSISVGKWANVFITRPIPSLEYIPYSFGSDLVKTVVIRGKVFGK